MSTRSVTRRSAAVAPPIADVSGTLLLATPRGKRRKLSVDAPRAAGHCTGQVCVGFISSFYLTQWTIAVAHLRDRDAATFAGIVAYPQHCTMNSRTA